MPRVRVVRGLGKHGSIEPPEPPLGYGPAVGKSHYMYSVPHEESRKLIFEVFVNLVCHGT